MKELPPSYDDRCEKLLQDICEQYGVEKYKDILGIVLSDLENIIGQLISIRSSQLSIEEGDWRQKRKIGNALATIIYRVNHDTELNALIEEAMIDE